MMLAVSPIVVRITGGTKSSQAKERVVKILATRTAMPAVENRNDRISKCNCTSETAISATVVRSTRTTEWK